MKIAISSTGKTVNSEVDTVFGRCKYFVIVESENKKIIEAIKNEGCQQRGGAGIFAAQLIVKNKAKALITGNIGPRALDVLKQFDIPVYRGNGKIEEVVDKLMKNELEKASEKDSCQENRI